MAEVACIGCGAIFEDREGPTHPYMECLGFRGGLHLAD
jgi:hypothetical protein